jgi:hypothetical protein
MLVRDTGIELVSTVLSYIVHELRKQGLTCADIERIV